MKKAAWTALLLLACSPPSSQSAFLTPAAEPRVTHSLKQQSVPDVLTVLFRQAGLTYRL